ncbi:phosphatidylinositol phosphate synthase [Pseudactinotalea sp. Z1739]|uniref:phosphatidylinositol phosphate synthase n=1 Tax=Pseudactinotalea sp. Z1739 TaxID=3413028 RepID=UPI003C7B1A60
MSGRIFGPVAQWLLRRGIGPNTVSVTGTVAAIVAALALLGTGRLVIGPIAIGLILLTDSLDGIMARRGPGPTDFGSFLDSTLDRLADAAVFLGLVIYFVRFTEGPVSGYGVVAATVCMALAMTVSYARAKAESLARTASVGLAERADRLVVALAAALAVGLGLSPWLLVVVLGLLALASAVTVTQRIVAVWRQGEAR